MYRQLLFVLWIVSGYPLFAQSALNRPSEIAPDLPEVLRQQLYQRDFLPAGVPIPKGLRSKEEWRRVIDRTWDDGLATDTQLAIFDSVWTQLSERFICFQGLDVDWDEIRTRYRPEIEIGITRGRFASILSHMVLPLRESHTWVWDNWVHYRTRAAPGVPLVCVGAWGDNKFFGAALTPLPDESLLVYKSPPDHPLGLVPGDIVLGYEGVPWKDLYPQLIEAELPISGWWWGSCPSAYVHSWLIAAGMNWHLFSSIDVLKAESGQTVHLSIQPLMGSMPQIFNSEQLPVPGVEINSLQDIYAGDVVNWGIVEGTQIGYIYVWGWYGTAGEEFLEAVESLLFDHETEGLIIDFRTNYGGNMFLSYDALELLFDQEVWTIDWVDRADPGDLTSVKLKNIARFYRIQGDPDSFYDKPIAVLTGPGALSSGDQVALRMRFHPNSRFFGKPTAAAFNSPRDLDLDEFEGQWTGRYAAADAVLTSDLDRSLTRTPLKVDQDIWLRPEDVRQGRDTVVQAAMDWIHGVTLPKRLHFTHFGDGAGVLRSRLLLLSQSPDTPVAGRLKLRDDQGDPLETDFAGHQLRGQLEVKVAPMQPWVESSDGTGDVRSGSLTIWMDGALDGVLLYGGPIGLAGIPPSPVLERGFLAPILEDELQDIASAVAISNATDKETEITLELLDASGHPLATASLTLPSFGHVALYAHEFGWSQPVDLSRFLGVIRASYSGAVVAVALQTRPGELAALPVTERLGNESAPSENTSDAEVHELYFPHFGDGRGLLSSQILLLNPSSETARDIEVILTNDHGDPLTVDLNGTVIEGSVAVEIPPNGISSLQTDGIGSTIAGSVRIVSSSPVTGVVLFGGPTGVAGVGSSRAVSSGFLAPVEIKEEGNPFAATNYIIRTGIALRNLESDREVSLTLHLRNLAGKLLNTTSLVLPPGGHLARYLDELDWDRIFFHSELLGLLEVDSAGDRIAAIILRSEPGQLATFPVVPVLGSVVTDVQEIGTSGER